MILLLLLAVIWYMTGKKRLSVITFFAMLTSGFQLIPVIASEALFGLKQTDYAIGFLLVAIVTTLINSKSQILNAKLPKYSWLLIGFLIISFVVNILVFKISIGDVIKNERIYMLLLSPLIFNGLTKDDLTYIIDKIYKITLFTAVIYSLQPFLNIQLLTGYMTEGKSSLFGLIDIPRFYNVPIYIFFFFFYAFFRKGVDKKQQLLEIAIMSLPIVLSLGRSMLLGFIMVLALVIFIDKIKMIIPWFIISLVVLIPLSNIMYDNASKGNTLTDIQGAFEVDIEEFIKDRAGREATFTFRIAHLYERFDEMAKDPMNLIFGLGFMSEESQYTASRFDFIVGLEDEETGDVVQIETSDIAWSMLIVRLGILGTIIYMMFYSQFLITFLKNKENIFAKVGYAATLVILILSLTSITIINFQVITMMLLFYTYVEKISDKGEGKNKSSKKATTLQERREYLRKQAL